MKNTKTVLLTGATGFVGRHMVRRLQKAGVIIEAISLHGGQVYNVDVDAVDVASDEELFGWVRNKRFDSIVHLAAAIPSSSSDPGDAHCFKTNVSGVLNILAMARDRGCHIVYTSSTSVYGPNKDFPLGETAIPQPQSLYVSSKYVGDALCEYTRINEGLQITTLRISAPYGPGSHQRAVINIFLQAALASTDVTLLGSGSRTQDFTYVDDITDAIYLSITSPASGIFNIASGRPVTMKQLAATVLQAVPESRSRIVYLDRPDPQEDYRANFNVVKAERELGWNPQTPLLEGLKRTAQALKETMA